MPFAISYSAEAFVQLKKLEKQIAKRVIKKLDTTRANPFLYFKRLVGRTEYKRRVGDYRAIADIDNDKKIIFVRALGHRKNIYK